MKMLVVDDSLSLRERLVRMFSGMKGVELVAQAADVRLAYDAVEEMQPEVIILDIQMRDGNGIDLLRDVKQKYPDTVAIMLTNYPYAQYRQKCAELGADYFFSKSTDLKQLIKTIQQLAGESGFHE